MNSIDGPMVLMPLKDVLFSADLFHLSELQIRMGGKNMKNECSSGTVILTSFWIVSFPGLNRLVFVPWLMRILHTWAILYLYQINVQDIPTKEKNTTII